MNGEMCAMIDRELYKQGCLKGVAQRVLDDVCLLHKNLFKGSKKVREDMTLLIRLFNYEFKRYSYLLTLKEIDIHNLLVYL